MAPPCETIIKHLGAYDIDVAKQEEIGNLHESELTPWAKLATLGHDSLSGFGISSYKVR
jgi:hypothetical protein